MDKGLVQYAAPLHLPAYEYRMCEKLHAISKKLAASNKMSQKDKVAWRSRYAFDMRDRILHGPENYMDVPPPYRIWVWPRDIQHAMAALNLTPSKRLTE